MKNLKGPPFLSKRHPPTPSFGLCLNPLTVWNPGIWHFMRYFVEMFLFLSVVCFRGCLASSLSSKFLQQNSGELHYNRLKRNLKMLQNFKFQVKSVYRYISSSVSSLELHGYWQSILFYFTKYDTLPHFRTEFIALFGKTASNSRFYILDPPNGILWW